MEFLNPLGLWGLAALPLLLAAYFLRERPPRRTVPAVFLFRGTPPERHARFGGPLRLVPLFWVQLALLLCAVASLARPARIGETTRSALVIDDSASLLAREPGGVRRFEDLRDSALRVLEREGSERFDVFTLAPAPAPAGNGLSRREARDLLRRLEAGTCADPDDATVGSFLGRLARQGYARIHVFTDRPGRTSPPIEVHTTGAPADNLALARFEARAGPRGPHAELDLASYAGAAAEAVVTVDDADSGRELARRDVELAPGEIHSLAIDLPPASRYRAELKPADPSLDALVEDDVSVAPGAAPRRRVLVVGRDPGGLERLPGLEVETIAPESYEPAAAEGRDLVVFRLSAPAEPPEGPALYLLPPAAPFLPRTSGEVSRPEIATVRPTHPAVRYLNPALLRPRRALAFEPAAGWEPLLVASGGTLLSVRDGERRSAVSGLDLLPFLGDANRAASILLLDLVGWLTARREPTRGGSCTLAGSPESDLRAPRPLPVPDGEAGPPVRVPVARPLWRQAALASLFLLALEWLLQVRSKTSGIGPTGLRALVAILLALAALDPQRTVAGTAPRPALLVDQSGSVLPEARARVLRELEAFPVAATIPFGTATETDLEEALARAAQQLPASTPILFVTDGWQTRGDVRRVVPALRRRDLRVFPLPVEQDLAGNVAVERLALPASAWSGEPLRATILLRNDNAAPVRGRLAIRRGRRVLQEESLRLPPGETVLVRPVLLAGEGLVEYSAQFAAEDPAADRFTDDDQATAWVSALPRRPILLVGSARANRYLEAALTRRGLRVESRDPGSLPELGRFGAVILNDVAFGELGVPRAEAIREWVRGGGGLLAIGGGRSFGPGGWADTALEEALPVRMAPREREEPRNAVALVIDKSGSMREEERMAYAKEAARELAERMNPRDLLTVIAFDRRAFAVVPLSQVSQVRAELEERLARLRPSGGTRLYPALIEAQRALSDLRAWQRHVIVLSDGLSEDTETAAGQRAYYDLALALASRGVKISTIALGRQADVRFLERLANFGRGAFHQTDDPSKLPELVLGGLEERGRETTVREERIRPRPAVESPLVGEIARAEPAWPPLFGFVETRPKPDARLDVAAPGGEPLIASWTYGRGRAVAVTTDAAGRWSDAWVRWEQWPRLWADLVSWLAPETPAADAAFTVSEEDGAIAVELARFDSDPPGAPLAILSSEAGETARSPMRRIAPGLFRAELSPPGPGEYRIEVRGIGGSAAPAVLGYTVPRSATAERPRRHANWALLDDLARATGGTVAPAPQELAAPPPAEERPLAEWLLPAAVLLFLGEVLLRRLRPAL